MKLCHVTKRSGLLSLAQYRYSSDTCHMTQLRSFICLPQPPFWGIVFSSNAWPFAAIVVGSVSTISLAFCISCLESPRSLLKYCLNIINYKMPTKLKKKIKKNLRGQEKKNQCHYFTQVCRTWIVWKEKNLYFKTPIFIFECLSEQGANKTQVCFIIKVPATLTSQAHHSEPQSQPTRTRYGHLCPTSQHLSKPQLTHLFFNLISFCPLRLLPCLAN